MDPNRLSIFRKFFGSYPKIIRKNKGGNANWEGANSQGASCKWRRARRGKGRNYPFVVNLPFANLPLASSENSLSEMDHKLGKVGVVVQMYFLPQAVAFVFYAAHRNIEQGGNFF